MSTTPCVSKLNVYRRLSDGRQVVVGQLAQNSKGVFFQYDAGYLAHYHSLSPFKMPFDSELCKAPKTPQVDPEGPGPRRWFLLTRGIRNGWRPLRSLGCNPG
jgi:hypothetical protein